MLAAIQFRQLALKSPPLGPKWGRWARKLGCASDPPVCSLLAWEDWIPGGQCGKQLILMSKLGSSRRCQTKLS